MGYFQFNVQGNYLAVQIGLNVQLYGWILLFPSFYSANSPGRPLQTPCSMLQCKFKECHQNQNIPDIRQSSRRLCVISIFSVFKSLSKHLQREKNYLLEMGSTKNCCHS